MTIVEQLFLLDRLDGLIYRKGTGRRKDLAKRLNIGMRSINVYLDILKDLGAEVEYCREANSYIYTNHFRFQLKQVCNARKRQEVKSVLLNA